MVERGRDMSTAWGKRRLAGVAVMALALPLLSACGREEEKKAVAPRPVRTIKIGRAHV